MTPSMTPSDAPRVVVLRTEDELERAYRFFTEHGQGQEDRSDYRRFEEVVVALERDGQVIAAVRMSFEYGPVTLRTMLVTESMRGQGLGRRLNRAFVNELGDRACFLLAFGDLIEFYGEVGFELIADDEAPGHMIRRRDIYTDLMSMEELSRRGGFVAMGRALGAPENVEER